MYQHVPGRHDESSSSGSSQLKSFQTCIVCTLTVTCFSAWTFINRSADQCLAPQICSHHLLVFVCIHSEDDDLIFFYGWQWDLDVLILVCQRCQMETNYCSYSWYFILHLLMVTASVLTICWLWSFLHFSSISNLRHHLHHLVTWKTK